LILHHFKGGKQTLWIDVKEQAVITFSSAFPAIGEETQITAERTRDAFRAYFLFCVEHPDFMKIGEWIRITEGTSADWGGEAEIMSRLAAFARRAQALGYLRDDIPTFDLMMVFSGAVKSWIFDGQHFLNVSGGNSTRQDKDSAFFESAFTAVSSPLVQS